MSKPIQYSTLFDSFINSYELYKDQTAYIYNFSESEFNVTYEKFFDDVLLLSRAFKSKKMKKGSKVMFLSDNRYAWIVTDMAMISLGAVSVPRGSDTPTQELEFIINHAECNFLVIETEQLYKQHEEMIKKLKLKAIFIIEAEKVHKIFDNVYSYNDILLDREISDKEISDFINFKNNLTSKDIFTLIYTSGTTGTPKGVILTHQNIMYNVVNLPGLIGLKHDDTWLSVLPSWHVFERACEYLALSNGCCMVYSSIKTFGEDLEKYKPTMVATVPRLWEAMYTKINNALHRKDPKKAKMFNKLVKISALYNYNERIINNNLPIFEEPSNLDLIIKKMVARIKLFFLAPLNSFAKKKLMLVQDKFGGRLKMAISGGGSLPDYLDEWIDALGIRIVNAYGMTECAPGIAGRALNCDTFGTLGLPIEGTDLKIIKENGELVSPGEESEIYVRGDQLTPGYFKNNEENQKAFTKDGFFKTGDLGKLTINGELVLTGRSKEIIVLANGENIDPTRIESAITMLPFISDAVLIGQDKKGLGALIVPDFEKLKEFVTDKMGLTASSTEHILANKQILNKVKTEMNKLLVAKKGFKPFEKLQNIHFLDKDFKPGEELTNTLKKKRHVIEKKYKEIINKILK